MEPGVSMYVHSGQLFEIKHNLLMSCNAIEDTKQWRREKGKEIKLALYF